MNKDQVKGRAKQAEGKIKEVTGKVTGNKQMEADGKIKKNVGKVQSVVGDARNDLAKQK